MDQARWRLHAYRHRRIRRDVLHRSEEGIIRGYNIICGDCYELIKRVPDSSVDLVVTDPPYEFNTGKGGGAFGADNRVYHSDVSLDDRVNKGDTDEILKELVRVMKGVNIYIWCNKNQIKQYLDFFMAIKGVTMDLLTWHKTNPVPTCNNKYLSDTEYCLFFRKGHNVYGSFATKRKYYVTQTNVADKKLYGHPTIKPLDIIANLVTNSSKPGRWCSTPSRAAVLLELRA